MLHIRFAKYCWVEVPLVRLVEQSKRPTQRKFGFRKTLTSRTNEKVQIGEILYCHSYDFVNLISKYKILSPLHQEPNILQRPSIDFRSEPILV